MTPLDLNKNNILLGENGTPLPISEDETLVLVLFKQNIWLRDAFRWACYALKPCKFFLTNKRIVITCDSNKAIRTFFVCIDCILSVENKKIKFMLDDNTEGILNVDCSLSFTLLEKEIKKILSKTVVKSENIFSDDIPLYYQLNE